MIDLVLSLDYEIFGNGSGDVRRDMIDPTYRLLTLCGHYGAKVTIFLEVGEYWAMKKADEDGSLSLGYSPCREIEEQVRNAVCKGHDAQLHLHPWWIGANFKKNCWRLRPEYRRISDLPNGLGSEDDPFSVVGVLTRGKRTLEEMIHTVRPDYECLAYRAGEFWGQPSRKLILGLRRAGLLADSSVINDMYEMEPIPTDYRNAPSSDGYWWTSSDDISESGPIGENIIEFPVYSRLCPYLTNFKWTKLAATIKRHLVEKADPNGHGMTSARKSTASARGVIKNLFTKKPIKYDFCKLSATDMILWLQLIINNNRPTNKESIMPVVMLGHSKDYWNDHNLEQFLRYIQAECEDKVRFSTLAELTDRIRKGGQSTEITS